MEIKIDSSIKQLWVTINLRTHTHTRFEKEEWKFIAMHLVTLAIWPIVSENHQNSPCLFFISSIPLLFPPITIIWNWKCVFEAHWQYLLLFVSYYRFHIFFSTVPFCRGLLTINLFANKLLLGPVYEKLLIIFLAPSSKRKWWYFLMGKYYEVLFLWQLH